MGTIVTFDQNRMGVFHDFNRDKFRVANGFQRIDQEIQVNPNPVVGVQFAYHVFRPDHGLDLETFLVCNSQINRGLIKTKVNGHIFTGIG